MTKIKQQQYQELLCRDQLTIEKGEEKVFLHYGKTWPLAKSYISYKINRDRVSTHLQYVGIAGLTAITLSSVNILKGQCSQKLDLTYVLYPL